MSFKPPSAPSAGAYVIRNKQTSTVLHMESPDPYRTGADVLAYTQDEAQYKDQQIWWIEPLAHHESEDTEPEKGLLFSITNPASGRSLDANPQGEHICTWEHHGCPWQRWRLREVLDTEDGEICYNIVGSLNDKVVDIASESSDSGTRVNTQKYSPECRQHCWELVIPVIAFPPAWFHIQNAGTGDLLRQNYVYNSPMLLPPPDPPKQSQYREQWEFQWTLTHTKCFGLSTDDRNSWCIVNRLTRARLSPLFGNIREEDFAGRFENLSWKLELDMTGNWKITNLKTLCLLQQTNIPHNGGKAVGCDNRKFSLKGGSQSWVLRPPLLYKVDPAQPLLECGELED